MFQQWKRKNPAKSFAEFSAQRIVKTLRKGYQHPTLRYGSDASTAPADGEEGFEIILRAYQAATGSPSFPPSLQVCDYGCGSLRIGLHLIRRLDQERYIGLDVVDDFIDHGRSAFAETISQKKPLLGTIREKIGEAVLAAPDLVFALNVVSHVHPDEAEAFYRDIRALAHKSGSLVILHVLLSETPIRFQRSGWAWPDEYYIERMEPLKLVSRESGPATERNGHQLRLEILTFRNLAA